MQILAKSTKFHHAKGEFYRLNEISSRWPLQEWSIEDLMLNSIESACLLKHNLNMSIVVNIADWYVCATTGNCTNTIDSRYLLSPRESLKHFEISVPRYIRYAKLRKTINRTTTFHKWRCNLTPDIRDIFKILSKRGGKRRNCSFLLFSAIFCYLLLDFHVKTRTRFSLRDKRLFEISEVEITSRL